eukprot:scaffold347_cov380-Prasinococcus_capsulatus_cf.AAC.15
MPLAYQAVLSDSRYHSAEEEVNVCAAASSKSEGWVVKALGDFNISNIGAAEGILSYRRMSRGQHEGGNECTRRVRWREAHAVNDSVYAEGGSELRKLLATALRDIESYRHPVRPPVPSESSAGSARRAVDLRAAGTAAGQHTNSMSARCGAHRPAAGGRPPTAGRGPSLGFAQSLVSVTSAGLRLNGPGPLPSFAPPNAHIARRRLQAVSYCVPHSALNHATPSPRCVRGRPRGTASPPRAVAEGPRAAARPPGGPTTARENTLTLYPAGAAPPPGGAPIGCCRPRRVPRSTLL